MKRKKRPRRSYVRKRLSVSKHLNECPIGSTSTRFQTIIDLEKQIVLGNLKKTFPAVHTFESKLKDELELVYDALFNQKSLTPTQKKAVRQALIFELKSRIMKHPHDIQNSRRVFGIISMFDEIWNENNNHSRFRRFKKSISSCWTSLSLLSYICCSQVFKLFNCCCAGNINMDYTCSITCSWGLFSCRNKESSPPKYSFGSIAKTVALVVLVTIGSIYFDYKGDIQVLLTFWEILEMMDQDLGNDGSSIWTISLKASNDSTSILRTITSAFDITNNSSWHNEGVINELLLPVLFLMLILLFSTISLLYYNLIRMLATEVRTTLKMGSPTVEENDEPVPVSGTLHRYDLSIEDSKESGYQFIVQWGTYFSISMLISIATTLDVVSNSTGLTKIDEVLKFEILYRSGMGSLLALTLAQIKSNKVQNEYNTALNIPVIGNIFYFVAALANTLVTAMILANLATSVFGCSFLLPVVINSFSAFFGPYMFLLFTILVCGSIQRILRPNHNSLPGRLPGQDTFMSLSLPPYILRLLTLYSACYSGMFSAMMLPTSQTRIPYKGYLSYNTSLLKSPDLLKLLRTQLMVYIVLITATIFVNIGACSIFEFSPTFIAISNSTTNLTNLTPSNVSPARYNLLLHTSYGIPLGFILSYVMIWLYFMMDAGFFSISNMEFFYKYVHKRAKVFINEKYPEGKVNEDQANVDTEIQSQGDQDLLPDLHNNDHPTKANNGYSNKLKVQSWCYKFWLGDDKSIPEEAVRGNWMDLNGTESEDEEDSDDGTIREDEDILENCSPCSPEFRVKMSFHYYQPGYQDTKKFKKKKEEPVCENDETPVEGQKLKIEDCGLML